MQDPSQQYDFSGLEEDTATAEYDFSEPEKEIFDTVDTAKKPLNYLDEPIHRQAAEKIVTIGDAEIKTRDNRPNYLFLGKVPKKVEYNAELDKDNKVNLFVKQTHDNGITVTDKISNIGASRNLNYRAAFLRIKDQSENKPELTEREYIERAFAQISNETLPVEKFDAQIIRFLNSVTVGGFVKLFGDNGALSGVFPDKERLNRAIDFYEAEDIRKQVVPFFNDSLYNQIVRSVQFGAELFGTTKLFNIAGSVVHGFGAGAKISGLLSKAPTLSKITAKGLAPFKKDIENKTAEIVSSGIDGALTFGGVEVASQLINTGQVDMKPFMAAIITGGYFPQLSASFSKVFESTTRREAFKNVVKGITYTSLGTAPEIIIDRAAAIQKEENADFITALGMASSQLGEDPMILIEHAFAFAILGATGSLNRFTAKGDLNAQLSAIRKMWKEKKIDETEFLNAEKVLNDLVKQYNLQTVKSKAIKQDVKERSTVEEKTNVEKTVAEEKTTATPIIRQPSVEQKVETSIQFGDIKTGDVIVSKTGKEFTVVNADGKRLYVKDANDNPKVFNETTFVKAELRKVERPTEVSESKEKITEPTPGTRQSIEKFGIAEDQKRIIDAVADGTKPVGVVYNKLFVQRAEKAGLSVEKIDESSYYVYKNTPEGLAALQKAKDAKTLEESGKAFGYTEKEIAEQAAFVKENVLGKSVVKKEEVAEDISKKGETKDETVELPKSFRITLERELQAKGLGKEDLSKLSDAELVNLAKEKNVRTEVDKNEAPVGPGEDMSVRGPANQEMVDKAVKSGKLSDEQLGNEILYQAGIYFPQRAKIAKETGKTEAEITERINEFNDAVNAGESTAKLERDYPGIRVAAEASRRMHEAESRLSVNKMTREIEQQKKADAEIPDLFEKAGYPKTGSPEYVEYWNSLKTEAHRKAEVRRRESVASETAGTPKEDVAKKPEELSSLQEKEVDLLKPVLQDTLRDIRYLASRIFGDRIGESTQSKVKSQKLYEGGKEEFEYSAVETMKQGIAELKRIIPTAKTPELKKLYEKKLQEAEDALAKLGGEEEPSSISENLGKIKSLLPQLEKAIREIFGDLKSKEKSITADNLQLAFLRSTGLDLKDIESITGIKVTAISKRLVNLSAALKKQLETKNPTIEAQKIKERLTQLLKEDGQTEREFVEKARDVLGIKEEIARGMLNDAAYIGWSESTKQQKAVVSQIERSLGGKLFDITGYITEKVAEKYFQWRDRIRAQKALDSGIVKEATKTKSMFPGADLFKHPLELFKEHKEAYQLVVKTIKAELEYYNKVEFFSKFFKDIADKLLTGEAELITKKLNEKQELAKLGKTNEPDPILSLPERLQPVAKAIHVYFNEFMRPRIIEAKKEEFLSLFKDGRGKALRDIVENGISVTEAAKKYKLRESGVKVIKEALKELDEINSWGKDDYITHIELGDWKLTNAKGRTVAVAKTRLGIVEKAQKFVDENPGLHGEFYINNDFSSSVEFPLLLGKKAYYRVLSRMAKSIDATVSDVHRQMRERGRPIAIKFGRKWASAMQRRHDILKGEENIFDVIPAYSYSIEKKLALDPIFRESQTVLDKLPPREAKALEKLLTAVKGRKTFGDELVDDFIQGLAEGKIRTPFGEATLPIGKTGRAIASVMFDAKPFAYSRGISQARKLMANLKLGYRPSSILMNRIGGFGHTWVTFGSEWIAKGREFQKTKEFEGIFKQDLADLGVHVGLSMEGGSARSKAAPLGLFQAVEPINRKETLATAYIYGRDKLNLTGKELNDFAVQSVWQNQFIYNIAASPAILRNPTGKLMFQFKSYLLNEIRFMSNLNKEQWGRYLKFQMATGGPKGFVYFLKTLPIVGMLGYLDDAEDWLNKNWPEFSRGIPGLFGIDLSTQAIAQLPFQKVEDIIGPTLSEALKLWKTVLAPAITNNEFPDYKNFENWSVNLAPAIMYWHMLIDRVSEENGWITDERGRKKFNPTAYDKVKLLFGFNPLNKSIQSFENYYQNKLNDIHREDVKNTVDELIQAVNEGDEERVNRLVEKMVELNATVPAERLKDLPPNLRTFKHTPKPLREGAYERLEIEGEL